MPCLPGYALRTRDTSVLFLLGLPMAGMTLLQTHTLVHKRQAQSFLYQEKEFGALRWSPVHLESQLPAPVHRVYTDSQKEPLTDP